MSVCGKSRKIVWAIKLRKNLVIYLGKISTVRKKEAKRKRIIHKQETLPIWWLTKVRDMAEITFWNRKFWVQVLFWLPLTVWTYMSSHNFVKLCLLYLQKLLPYILLPSSYFFLLFLLFIPLYQLTHLLRNINIRSKRSCKGAGTGRWIDTETQK